MKMDKNYEKKWLLIAWNNRIHELIFEMLQQNFFLMR